MNDKNPLPKVEGEPYVHQAFPAWCKGPNGEGRVFGAEGDVPAGWTMPDGSTKGGKAKPAAAPTPPTVTPAPVEAGSAEVDASGAVWDENLHRPTKSKNKAGLWHMKVGTSRPVAEPLDL